jgi:hypothetical protein
VRALVALLSVLAVPILFLTPAAASCAPPTPVADNAARAVAVVHGTVTDVGPGSLTLRVDRVLKGSVGGTIVAFVGPGRGGAGGTAVATSVDYAATVGTEHVLYIIRGDDGQLETNACIGSHAGPPNAEETAHFGAGTTPDPAIPAGPQTERGPLGLLAAPDPAWIGLIVALIACVVAVALGIRVARPRTDLDRG